jgi:energy-coupling factor transporter ATP-binding protein EcfA2
MFNLPLSEDRALALECKPDAREFTVYVPALEFRRALWAAVRPPLNPPHLLDELDLERRFDLQAVVRTSGSPVAVSGRLHAALCFRGTKFSVTFRADSGTNDISPVSQGEPLRCDAGGWEINDHTEPAYRLVYDHIAEAPGEWKGLILVTGRTGSGKTTCLNHLLALYLRNSLGGSVPNPHVVATGDPVEVSCLIPGGSNPGTSGERINFTARTLGIDVLTVGDALNDALRETPMAVVAGELRGDDDFRAALRFAGTGHLVLATAHNSSLVDAFAKLIEVTEAKFPSDRAGLVQHLRAVVHIESLPDGLKLPALWRSTPAGRQNFVSEGLSSILPAPTAGDSGVQRGVLGRYWMLQRLKQAASDEERKYALALDIGASGSVR